jgi:hypothetical protein
MESSINPHTKRIAYSHLRQYDYCCAYKSTALEPHPPSFLKQHSANFHTTIISEHRGKLYLQRYIWAIGIYNLLPNRDRRFILLKQLKPIHNSPRLPSNTEGKVRLPFPHGHQLRGFQNERYIVPRYFLTATPGN